MLCWLRGGFGAALVAWLVGWLFGWLFVGFIIFLLACLFVSMLACSFVPLSVRLSVCLSVPKGSSPDPWASLACCPPCIRCPWCCPSCRFLHALRDGSGLDRHSRLHAPAAHCPSAQATQHRSGNVALGQRPPLASSERDACEEQHRCGRDHMLLQGACRFRQPA